MKTLSRASRPTRQADEPVKAVDKAKDGNGVASVLPGKLRRLRTRAMLTLQDLSLRSGISASALSKIENGQLSPTYEKIVALADGLEVDVSELFSSRGPSSATGRRGVTRKNAGVHHVTPQYEYELLCADLSNKEFVPLLATLKAHSLQDFPDLLRHTGEEFLYVLHGQVTVHSEFYAPLLLKQGDCCYFDSAMGHACVSSGTTDSEVLWVCSKNPQMPKQ